MFILKDGVAKIALFFLSDKIFACNSAIQPLGIIRRCEALEAARLPAPKGSSFPVIQGKGALTCLWFKHSTLPLNNFEILSQLYIF